MEPQNCPDSWTDDSGDDNGGGLKAYGGDNGSTTTALNEITSRTAQLNVSAAPFVPGKNVFATEFVPSFGAAKTQPPAQVVSSVSANSYIPTEVPAAVGDLPASRSQPMADEGCKVSGPEPVVATAEAGMDVDSEAGAQQMEDDDDIPDDWSDKASESSSTIDEGGGCGEDGDAVAMAASKPKKMAKVQNVAAKRKSHLNIVFIGHVDAGKSTIGGHIMYLTGQVDKRTLEKYEREAKEKNRESWYLSWALDTNLEERDKGKTVEVGRAFFETESKHFTILDAPGHKSFVPNMIGGASQADVAVLVISARRGEFETGFERGGQTREHAMLVKTAGVRHLIVVVNKMDDPTVEWDESRFNEIRDKLTPYLRKCGFNPKTDLFYLPVSGLTGINLKDVCGDVCSWYDGPSLIQYLDTLPPVSRMDEGPVRLPIVDRYKDMGTIVLGKLESGVLFKGQTLTLMPNKLSVEVMQLFSDEDEVEKAYSGENVKLKLKNVEEEDVCPGFMLCSPDNLCHTAKIFDAQVAILEYKSIICAGYSAVMHIHTCAEEVAVKALLCLIDKKTNEKSTMRPRFIKQDQVAIVRLEMLGGLVCLEAFKDFPQMGRFTLRDEGKTVGIGKVLKVIA
jgi:peptide chain release factor subunit 3